MSAAPLHLDPISLDSKGSAAAPSSSARAGVRSVAAGTVGASASLAGTEPPEIALHNVITGPFIGSGFHRTPGPMTPNHAASAAATYAMQLPPAQTDLMKQLQGEQKLKPNDYSTALVHLYRGELARQTAYRQRLDQTTNWSVTLTVAMTGFSLSQTNISHWFHFVLIVFLLIICVIEARRYRYYVVSQHRVRLLETGFYADTILAGCVRSGQSLNQPAAQPAAQPPPPPPPVQLNSANPLAPAGASAAGGKATSPASGGGAGGSGDGSQTPRLRPSGASSASLAAQASPAGPQGAAGDDDDGDAMAFGPGAPVPRGGVFGASAPAGLTAGARAGNAMLLRRRSISTTRNPIRRALLYTPRPLLGTWEQQLAHSLRHPASPISLAHSCVIRLKRMYMFLVGGCLCGWLVKLSVDDALSPALVIPTFVVFGAAAIGLPFLYRESEEDV